MVGPRTPHDPVDDGVAAALAAAGQRLTRHRATLVAVLSSNHRPLTAEEVVGLSGLPLSTAYRNITDLVEAGVAVRVGGAGRSDRFELSEQFTDRHHHHLVCHRCGSVSDFDPSPALERAIRTELGSLPGGFVADHHIFDAHGVCANCADSPS